jgi:hypothetical protein
MDEETRGYSCRLNCVQEEKRVNGTGIKVLGRYYLLGKIAEHGDPRPRRCRGTTALVIRGAVK